MSRRAFVVVMDACGAGELPDAADYGDAGTSTLEHVAELAGGLDLPTMGGLGLGTVLELAGVPPAEPPAGVHGRLHPRGPGKDTITGHWELMGITVAEPLPTYPDGFPQELLDELERLWGREIIGNKAASGTAIIDELGPEHVETGRVIVYTSADSVLQIAAHVDVIGDIYALCESARPLTTVGRVIARPFEGEPGSFRRTLGRRDYALEPPGRSYLQEVQDAGVPVHSVGKVKDVFSGVGIDEKHPGADNETAIGEVTRLVEEMEAGLVFANFVDTDQVFGHRKDVGGFAAALRRIDDAAAGWLERLDPDNDLLILTADHGVDPKHPGYDHTREHVPLLAAFGGHGGRRHDGPMADVGASCLRWLTGRDADLPGTSFVP